MRILVMVILLCSSSILLAQKEMSDVSRGNRAYSSENYTEAEVNYRRGLDKNDQSFEGHFNLGDALFRQEKYPEALEQYALAEKLLQGDDKHRETEIKARQAATCHNMGNAYYAQKQYDKAVEVYQQSLRLNPKDHDTRYNLIKAMQQLHQQQQQNQQEQQDQQNPQQQQNQDQQQNQQQQQSQQEQEQQQSPNNQQMDKETAEQILEALEQDEQETQEKLQRKQGTKRRVEKEW